MTTTMIQPPKNDWPAHLRELREHYVDFDDLKSQFKACLELTAENLMRMAVLYRMMEEQGEDLSDLQNLSILPMLKRIAYGQLLAEVVHRHLGCSRLLSIASRLPISEQRQIAQDAPIEVGEYQGGDFTHRMIRPSRMDRFQMSQVFAGDRIRSVAEQRTVIDRQLAAAPKAHVNPYMIDRRRRLVRFTAPCELDLGQLGEIYQALRG